MSAPLIFDATEADFERLVLQASRQALVAVDFWAEWCPPCRVLTPVLERVVPEYAGKVRLAKVEVDENMRLAGRYRLRGFPTVILFGQGVEIDRFSSARSESFVRAFLDARLGGPAARSG